MSVSSFAQQQEDTDEEDDRELKYCHFGCKITKTYLNCPMTAKKVVKEKYKSEYSDYSEHSEHSDYSDLFV